MKKSVLGPATVPRYLRSAERGGTWRISISPRFLSGYQPFTARKPGGNFEVPNWEYASSDVTLPEWRHEAQARFCPAAVLPQSSRPPASNHVFPSRELVLFMLGVSERDFYRLRAGAFADLPEAYRAEVRNYSSDDLIEVQRLFARRFRGTVANFAFSRKAPGEDLTLWEKGSVNPEFSIELLNALPIDEGREAETFARLKAELTEAIETQGFGGDWGKLVADGENIKVV